MSDAPLPGQVAKPDPRDPGIVRLQSLLELAEGLVAEYRYQLAKPDLALRAATFLGDRERDRTTSPRAPKTYLLQVEFDDGADYRRAWEAIEGLPEVVNIGFLHGCQFDDDEQDEQP